MYHERHSIFTDLAVYSIKDLEKLSGIKAHTLRVWEKRYGIIDPKRTETNIRYYLDDDLKKLLNIALLNKYGYKISKIAEMTEGEMSERVSMISQQMSENDAQLDALTISMIEMDEIKFDKILSQNIEQIGFEKTMMEVIYPFLDKLSVLWFTGSINAAQESFMANLIKQKIYVALDELNRSNEPLEKTFLIYLPEGETQELSMLFIHYILKVRNMRVINIGSNISFDDLRDAYEIAKPDYIFTMINEAKSRFNPETYIQKVSDFFEECSVVFSGYQVVQQKIESKGNCTILNSLDEVLNFLEFDTNKSMPGASMQHS